MQKTKDDSLEVEVYSKLGYKGVAEAIEKNLIEYTKKETGEKAPAAKLPIEDTFKIGATDANGAFKKAKKGGYEQRTVRLSVTAADLVPVFELLREYEAADFKAGHCRAPSVDRGPDCRSGRQVRQAAWRQAGRDRPAGAERRRSGLSGSRWQSCGIWFQLQQRRGDHWSRRRGRHSQ